MKRGTPRHKKMYDLAARLKIELPHAVGIMEMLWQHASQFARQGDIGTMDDSDIAGAVKWPKRPDALIEGLVGAKWLHRHEEYRLYIHDWPEHCEDSVKKWLKNNGKNFLPVYGKSLEKVVTISRKSLTSGTAEAKAKAEAKNQTDDGGFLACGFADPEEFEGWFQGLLRKHPNRNGNGAARGMLLELVGREDFSRTEFDSGYAACSVAAGDSWTKDHGRYAPNLGKFVGDKLWKFAPVDGSAIENYRPEATW